MLIKIQGWIKWENKNKYCLLSIILYLYNNYYITKIKNVVNFSPIPMTLKLYRIIFTVFILHLYYYYFYTLQKEIIDNNVYIYTYYNL